ncbi:hypothetical protein ACWEQ4_00885 [Rhodococcus sp. NPDC003994]
MNNREARARAARQRCIDSDPIYAEGAVPWEDFSDYERAKAIDFWSYAADLDEAEVDAPESSDPAPTNRAPYAIPVIDNINEQIFALQDLPAGSIVTYTGDVEDFVWHRVEAASGALVFRCSVHGLTTAYNIALHRVDLTVIRHGLGA